MSNVRLVNTGGQVNVNIYFRASGGINPIRIFDRDASLGTALTILKPELTMGPGDRIEMSTTSSPQVEYVVCGIEKV
ncbi:MAG: hypothetical protein L0Y58_23815 [Verrucomicrobia subdivision 3 bacterium]|nr:hypothetical protein [Limisphaerales bacterium]